MYYKNIIQMVNLKLKLVKNGNGYALALPMGLIKSGIIDLENKEYDIEIKDSKITELEEEIEKLKNQLQENKVSPPTGGFTSFLVPNSSNNYLLNQY